MAKNAPKHLLNATLDDKYTLTKGRIFITGTQALVRLPLLMRERDTAKGLNTAGFVSGYRGSPLARLDQQLWSAKKHLKNNHITFTPGINEDLGATAVWGSQQTDLYAGARYDGVFGMWYGKGPGVDRSMDVLRHANAAGSSKNGGVLAVMGDDHGCVSSTLGHQSDQSMMAAMIPVLHPADLQEYLDYGVLGWEMSRYAGCWVGMKCVTEVVESSASVEIDIDRIKTVTPKDFQMPEGGLHIRMPDPPQVQEKRLYPKIEAALAFARANKIDRTVYDTPKATFGIITTGKSYSDVLQAFDDLGIDEKAAKQLGIRLYKVGMVWPLEPQGARAFAQGLSEILVVEEKRDLIESQLKDVLYGMDGKLPKITGKRDDAGAEQFPAYGELTPTQIARALVARLGKTATDKEAQNRLKLVEKREQELKKHADKVVRLPYYCSGCPHNTSTKVPEGSRAVAGIGCHYMVQWMDRNSQIITHMGGEGVNWVGHAPFTDEPHVFSNLGDGTYYHSGFLAIRQAVAAKVNITYKILYNDAVAMTGGQPVEGNLTVEQISQELAAEGVKTITVVSDEPNKYPDRKAFAKGTTFHHRDDMETVQKQLRDTPGVSVIIYDQMCAAEKRRKRKRNQLVDPPKRAFINDAVCEGCGDCSVQSNCVSVEPLETEYGRKRQVNQSSCNKDMSCLKGFCPSFVTVHGGKIRSSQAGSEATDATFAHLPAPSIPQLQGAYNMLVTGIGGTGVITIGAIVGMAAHLEGKGVTVLDQTGLAQKNGSVMSHIKLAPTPADIHAVRIDTAATDVLLGCDIVVADNAAALSKIAASRTKAVINSHISPTAGFTLNPDVDFHEQAIVKELADTLGKDANFVNATTLATTLMGDAIATNMFVLGYAWQKGLVPLSLEALMRAVELNGVAINDNKMAFNWGRLAAHDIKAVEAAVRPTLHALEEAGEPISATLDEMLEKRMRYLSAYQNSAYAAEYAKVVEHVRTVEAKAMDTGTTALTEAVARYAFKLMAYKDEYEVARLYTNGDFLKKLNAQFEGKYSLTFHMAPPLLAAKDEEGHLKKMTFGPWMLKTFGILAKLKLLRGTPLDVFGYTEERKTERKLIKDYMAMVAEVCAELSPANHAVAVELASIPEHIRGYGHVKEKHLLRAKQREQILLETFRHPAAPKGSVKVNITSKSA
ncbi:MAG: indolepyruvate ferredoxin oxidoreductase family protein [Proteobacteria bacterium]|nr:indolepyruvate ferredoxin oxidoreductase family protein [Pseudomonadota bacterium]